MDKLIDLNAYPVSKNLKALLKDKTTKKNIIFATSVYSSKGTPIKETEQMTEEILKGFTQYEIQPRVLKNKEQQQERTKAKAEVFTPSWICNKMNNHCDEEWFGRKDVFNVECEQGWLVTTEKVEFDTADGWKKYVDSKRLEITCGEAPYIVSRYDAATGELLEIRQRIGILDRKLRVVNENTDSETEWFKWVLRAYQSVYGYEFQGDSLLIARINLLITFVDYMQDRWGRVPTDVELRKIVNVIVWNLWQMDGISGTIPFGKPKEEYHQFSLFDFVVSLTTGAGEAAYSAETGTTIDELLAPIRLTAKLTQLNFAGHVVTHGVSYSLRNDAEKAQEMIAKSQVHAKKLVEMIESL